MPRIQAATSLTILSRLTPTQNLLDEISSSLAIMLCYRCEAHQAIVVKCDRNRLDWQRLRWPIKPAVCSAKELTSSPPESAGRPAHLMPWKIFRAGRLRLREARNLL